MHSLSFTIMHHQYSCALLFLQFWKKIREPSQSRRAWHQVNDGMSVWPAIATPPSLSKHDQVVTCCPVAWCHVSFVRAKYDSVRDCHFGSFKFKCSQMSATCQEYQLRPERGALAPASKPSTGDVQYSSQNEKVFSKNIPPKTAMYRLLKN